MQITHINLADGFRGGERQTALLIERLSRKSIRQCLVCRKDSDLQKYLAKTPSLSFVASDHFLRGHFNLSERPGLCHAHEAKGAYWAYLQSLFSKSPYIITRRVLNPLSSNPLTHRVYQNAFAVTALSTAIEANLRRYDKKIGQIRVIPSAKSNLPVNPGNVKSLREKYSGKFLVGHIGALVNKDKGQHYLIEAAKDLHGRCRDLHFLLLGEGKDGKELREAAGDLENIEFAGFKPNVGDFLSIMDLITLPSLREGLGSILLDAMDFRVPIIASCVGGIPDVIEHGENGLLVPPADSRALSEAIETLYHDPEKRKGLAENGYRLSARYDAGKIAGAFLALYRQACGEISLSETSA